MSPPVPPPPPLAADLLTAARTFFPDLTGTSGIPGHPAIVRVDTPAGLHLVRRWPAGVPLSEIAFAQEVMRAAREVGTPAPAVVPPPGESRQPALRHEGHHFTAQTWLPGEPPARSEIAWPEPDDLVDVPVALSPPLCTAVVGAIARLHEAPPPATGERPEAPLGMLPGAVRQAHERHRGRLRPRASREPAIQRWLATSERLIGRAEPVVAAAGRDGAPRATLIHLGLWPAHVLVSDESFSGLLGWERAAVGSPLLDLAQAVLRLQGWRDEAVEMALGIYAEVRPLSPDERRLLPAVAALDAVATTGRLLEQTYAVPDTARPPGALRAAIDIMLGSLGAIERDLTAQESVGKSRRSPWRRAGPVAPRREREGGKPRVRRP